MNLRDAGPGVNRANHQEAVPPDVPTVAAVTSRSYHPGVVNGLLTDGSVRAFADTIALDVWRALATRCRGEVGTSP
jgi:hypothetical protein